MNIDFKGVFVKHKWRITKVKHEWSAYIPDEEFPDTGAPILKSTILDDLMDQIEIFEQGAAHASNSD